MKLLSRRKCIIYTLELNGTGYTPFEINLPSNVVVVTGVAVSNTASNTDNSIGTLCLQSQDAMDVFLMQDIYKEDINKNDEPWFNNYYSILEAYQPWEAGYKQQILLINVSGDTAKINGWYTSKYADAPYRLTIYLYYEDVAQVIPEESDTAQPDSTEQPKPEEQPAEHMLA